MRIGAISDIHIDINAEYPVIKAIADTASEKKIDLLIVAGDIAEIPNRSLTFLKRLKTLCTCGVCFVPGNHDMWTKNSLQKNNDEIYSTFLADDSCLCGRSVVLGDGRNNIALTGDIGWYDYTFAAPVYNKEALDKMELNGRVWQDKLYNTWTDDNKAKTDECLMKLESQLKACRNNPIMVVTHMLPIKDLCVPESREEWGYFNAFLGSSRYEALYKKYPVKYAICGHVHYRKTVEKDGITYICPCLGYHNEWPLFMPGESDVNEQVRDAMKVIEI